MRGARAQPLVVALGMRLPPSPVRYTQATYMHAWSHRHAGCINPQWRTHICGGSQEVGRFWSPNNELKQLQWDTNVFPGRAAFWQAALSENF
jgi:hypothetical protein